jgi:type I restriction enzyme M protein
MMSARNINSSLRIRELAERYATPLPALADEVEALSAKVGEHLKKMGITA